MRFETFAHTHHSTRCCISIDQKSILHFPTSPGPHRIRIRPNPSESVSVIKQKNVPMILRGNPFRLQFLSPRLRTLGGNLWGHKSHRSQCQGTERHTNPYKYIDPYKSDPRIKSFSSFSTYKKWESQTHKAESNQSRFLHTNNQSHRAEAVPFANLNFYASDFFQLKTKNKS